MSAKVPMSSAMPFFQLAGSMSTMGIAPGSQVGGYGFVVRYRGALPLEAARRRFVSLVPLLDATRTNEPPDHGSYAGSVVRWFGLHRAGRTRKAKPAEGPP